MGGWLYACCMPIDRSNGRAWPGGPAANRGRSKSRLISSPFVTWLRTHWSACSIYDRELHVKGGATVLQCHDARACPCRPSRAPVWDGGCSGIRWLDCWCRPDVSFFYRSDANYRKSSGSSCRLSEKCDPIYFARRSRFNICADGSSLSSLLLAAVCFLPRP